MVINDDPLGKVMVIQMKTHYIMELVTLNL